MAGGHTKRALFILITDYPGGAERIATSLALELSSRPGWKVEVVVACRRRHDTFINRLPPEIRVRYGPWHSWFLSVPLLPFRIAFRRYDLVFTTHVYVNAIVSALRRARLIRISRLIMRESMSLFDRFSGVKTRLFGALYRCYGGEDLLIAQTGYMADHVRPRLPAASARRLEVLPNPVNLSEIERGAAEPLEDELRDRLKGGPNILFCGRLVDFKRPEAALEVFRQVANHDQAARLVFMGAGALEADLRIEAKRHGLAERVLFLGYRADPHAVMAACQYGLLTSANEGFPNGVLEMMASGMRKIVITPCAGDLDSLTGVTVTRTHAVTEIAAELRNAMHSGEDRSALYRSVAATRSIGAYLDRVLGPLAGDRIRGER